MLALLLQLSLLLCNPVSEVDDTSQLYFGEQSGHISCIPSVRISSNTSCYFWMRHCQIQYHKSPIHVAKHHNILYMLIIGGIERNPVPRTVKYPCGTCKKACRWGQKAIACDNCDQWFHTSCMGMSSSRYEYLANTSISLICTACDTPNY